jgi:hypothetical protein
MLAENGFADGSIWLVCFALFGSFCDVQLVSQSCVVIGWYHKVAS